MEMGEPPGSGGGVGEGSEVTVVTREGNRPARSFHFCSKQYSNCRGHRHPPGVRDLNTRCSTYRTFAGNPLCDSSLPQSTGVNHRHVLCRLFFRGLWRSHEEKRLYSDDDYRLPSIGVLWACKLHSKYSGTETRRDSLY